MIILLIRKDEAIAMRDTLGFDAVKQSHSNHPKYYLVESRKNLKTLDNYRKNKCKGSFTNDKILRHKRSA